MTPVKLNVYISYSPDDKKTVKELYEFLRPMHDEVNIWYYDPPPAPKPLSVPWMWISSVLPIFIPYDYRGDYDKVDWRRKSAAHVYLFLTSYKSLNDRRFDDDIRLVASRRVEGDYLSPHIYPVILAPSLWKEKSALAGYDVMGPKKKTLVEIKPVEEGYLEIAKQLSKVVKDLQRDLDEAKFAQRRLVASDNSNLPAKHQAEPYLDGNEKQFQFKAPPQVNPPEWLGWMIWFFLFVSVLRGLQGEKPRSSSRFEYSPAPTEYRR
jgi:hypothetical protein